MMEDYALKKALQAAVRRQRIRCYHKEELESAFDRARKKSEDYRAALGCCVVCHRSVAMSLGTLNTQSNRNPVCGVCESNPTYSTPLPKCSWGSVPIGERRRLGALRKIIDTIEVEARHPNKRRKYCEGL